MFFRVQWIFAAGDYQKTETLYWGSGAATLQQCIVAVKNLTYYRIAMLSRTWNLDRVSINRSDVTLAQGIDLNAEVGAGPGHYGADSTCPGAEFAGRLYSGDVTWKRSYSFCGLPDSVAKWDPNTISAVPGTGSLWLGRLGNWVECLTEGKTPPGQTRGSPIWCIRARSTELGAVLPRARILSAVAVAPVYQWALEVEKPFVAEDGDRVHIHGMTDCNTKGLNGDATATLVDDSDPDIVNVLLNKRQCCKGDFVYDKRATIYKIVYNYRTIFLGQFGRVVNRRLGRPTVRPRGKAPTRPCCR